MTNTTHANQALSKLRVARGCIIGLELALGDAGKRTSLDGVREDLADARTFAQRAKGKIADAEAAMVVAFAAAQVPFSIRPRKGEAQADRARASPRAARAR